MQEKDSVDADTSQSLYELHISKVAPTHFCAQMNACLCVHIVERTAHCKS